MRKDQGITRGKRRKTAFKYDSVDERQHYISALCLV